jgi:hypothetical protein
MLFPLNPQTQQCAVFELLNNEVLHFLRACITARKFSQNLFAKYTVENVIHSSVCWSNKPTRNKYKELWAELPASATDRQQLFDSIVAAQDISTYFDDVHKLLPELNPDGLHVAFKELTTHLYTRTKDLEGIKQQAGSSINQHYQSHVAINGNSQLCFICGTASLSQNRPNLRDDDQWRSDYDHVLCKDKYPVFSVHPGNFLPACDICNRKSKRAHDLLRYADGRRRRAFYPLPPFQDACESYGEVKIDARNINELVNSEWDDPLGVSVGFSTAPAHLLEKINVWVEVYQVPQRVEEKVNTDFYERVSADLLCPQDFNDFKSLLRRKVTQVPADIRKTEWRFWWQKAYEFMSVQPDDFLQNVWALIEWKLQQSNSDDMSATFGI